MGKVIAVINQKGGVGKTTTSVNLSACLAYEGKKTLIIDCDPQGNATSGLGYDSQDYTFSVYDCLIDAKKADEAVIKTKYMNLYLLPSSSDLSAAEIELAFEDNREQFLKQITDRLKKDFDYIIIDAPPALGMITINVMTACDSVLIPIQCEYYALEGLSQLMNTVGLVRDRLNPELDIEGVVFTMYDARTNLSLQVVENVKNNLQQNIYKTIIPRNIRLAEAPSHGMPITKYDSKSTGAESYRLLAEEVIHRGEEEEW